jgi:hypothetical protein
MTVAAAGFLAALTMTTLPSYAEEPVPSDSPSAPGPEASPSATPESPAPSSPEPAPTYTVEPPEPDPGVETEQPVDLTVSVPGPKVTVGSAGKEVRVDVGNIGRYPAALAHLTLDASALSDQVEVELPGADQGCQVNGTKATCEYPDLAPNDIDTYVTFTVTPKPGAAEGVAGTVHAAVGTADPDTNPDNNVADVTIEPVGPVRAGGTELLTLAVINQGDEPSYGLTISIKLPPGSGGGGGGLPVTGTGLAWLVGGGTAMLLLGGVLLLVARWRRTPTSVVADNAV